MNSSNLLARNISAVTGSLESAMTSEEYCKKEGFLQKLDPRTKLFTFMLFIFLTALTDSMLVLAILLPFIMILGFLSKIPTAYLLRRIVLFVPVFTAVIAIPAVFITPGRPALQVAGHSIITIQGLHTASLLLLRVTDSISFAVLLVLTTRWTQLLTTMRWFRLPPLFTSILAMTYRYIFLLLHTVNSMFLARKSRILGTLSGRDERLWLGRTLATTMIRSFHMSEQVFLAMLSRGYRDDGLALNTFAFHRIDLLWLLFSLSMAILVFGV